jgi:hypothetical protein
MDDPFGELTIFDLTAAIGNTTEVANLLGISQSAVSRKYRQFTSLYRIVPSQKLGRYCLTSTQSPLEELRAAARRFRLLHGQLRLQTSLHELEALPSPLLSHNGLMLTDAIQGQALTCALQHGLIDAHIDTPDQAKTLWSRLSLDEEHEAGLIELPGLEPKQPLTAVLSAPIALNPGLSQLARHQMQSLALAALLYERS